MSVPKSTLRLPVELDHVRSACDFVTDAARAAGLSDDAIFHCELSVEEIFTNIVEHGYGDNGLTTDGKHIEIRTEQQPDQFAIVISDDAPPFNPLALIDPDTNMPLDERKTGGYGVFFVKKFMNDVHYRYEDNRNHLIMIKRRAS